MFFLSVIEHTLRLPPHLLGITKEKALRQELENLFLDKVIANLGLCVSVYDVHSISGGFKRQPTLAVPVGFHFSWAYYEEFCEVECRLVMFRPLVGKIIDAKLKEFNKDGLRLSMGFFDEIYIPFHLLPHPSRFAPDPENGWVWEYGAANDEQENAEASGTTYSIDEIVKTIRFRVHNIKYPPIPLEQPKDAKPFAPIFITGSLDNDGLGPLSWLE